jgi:hypothetical protein
MLQIVVQPTDQSIGGCNEKKLHGLSPRVNYTDRATAVGEVIANFCG